MEHQNQPKSLELEQAETAYWVACRASDKYGGLEEDFFLDVVTAGNLLFAVLEKEKRPGSQPAVVQNETEEDHSDERAGFEVPYEHPELTFNRFSAYVYLTVGFVAFLAVCAAIGW